MNTSDFRLCSRPQALLEVVNDLFEEQTDLEKIVRKIMQRALTLLQCERCSVLLLEDIDSPVRRLALYQHLKPLSSLLLNVVAVVALLTGREVLQDV